ncbi:hypothetical protein D9M71_277620 [compost metagenome]
MKQGALDYPLRPDGKLGPGALVLLVFSRVEAQDHPSVHLRDVTVEMERAAVDLHGLPVRLDALDGPGTSAKPQVFEGVAQFFVAAGGQLRYRHALLHVRVVTVQFLELQCLATQHRHQLAKALMVGVQVAVAEVELLALGVIDAQVERVACLAAFAHSLCIVAQVLERTQLAKAR